MSADIYKPGYEGERPSTTMTMPEKHVFMACRSDLEARVHEAMLTLSVQKGLPNAGVQAGGTPAHIVEFGDRVGQEKAEAVRLRFQPSPVQVSGYLQTLELLEGLSRRHFMVVLLRALHAFEKAEGGKGEWSWERIGEIWGLSPAWAERAYIDAMVQAARRGGMLPMVSRDYAVVVAGAWTGPKGWLTNISGAENPRLAVANLKGKSAIPPDQAFAVWVPGKPIAQRISEMARRAMIGQKSHGAWYKAHPDVVLNSVVEHARGIGADWLIDEIQTASLAAEAA